MPKKKTEPKLIEDECKNSHCVCVHVQAEVLSIISLAFALYVDFGGCISASFRVLAWNCKEAKRNHHFVCVCMCEVAWMMIRSVLQCFLATLEKNENNFAVFFFLCMTIFPSKVNVEKLSRCYSYMPHDFSVCFGVSCALWCIKHTRIDMAIG